MQKNSAYPMIAKFFIAAFLFNNCLRSVECSEGDRDFAFLTCVSDCKTENCSRNGQEFVDQPLYLQYLQWDCASECKYRCMWKTVDKLLERRLSIPQFYGKWPFIRILGIQEPASVLFSLFNLGVHLIGLRQIRKNVSRGAPLYWFWHVFTAVCVNAWIWSIAFHTRDTYVTELMDYFSAFSMVVFTFFAALVRFYEKPLCVPVLLFGLLLMVFCMYHVHYLAFVHFDYGYNMTANIAVGVLNAACWLIWSGLNRKSHPHAWKCTIFVVLAVASILLEVADFPPWFWTLDAHSLWHLTTAPITYIWYSFVVDDLKFLDAQQFKSKLP